MNVMAAGGCTDCSHDAQEEDMSSDVTGILKSPLMRDGRPDNAIIQDSFDGCLRWKRLRLWNLYSKEPRLLSWIVLNPAGTPGNDVPTPLPRKGAGWCMAMLSWRWGVDGFITYNVFPFADPKPATLARFLREHGKEPIKRTHALIARDIAPNDAAMAAWGSAGPPSTADFVANLLQRIDDEKGWPLNLWCLKTNHDGNPRHASRISHGTRPEPFRLSMPNR